MNTCNVVLIVFLLLYSSIITILIWQQNLTNLSETSKNDHTPSETLSNVISNKNNFMNEDLTKDIPYGSWIGNMWIPHPTSRLYTIPEIKSIFQPHSVLFLGDSLSRRAYATLYAILNSTSNDDISIQALDKKEVLNVNKKQNNDEPCKRENIPQLRESFSNNICRNVPGRKHQYFDYAKTCCFRDIQQLYKMDKTNFTQEYSLIIVALGAHERVEHKCRETHEIFPEDIFKRLNQTIALLKTIQSPSVSIVWRTAGFHEVVEFQNLTITMNEFAMKEIDQFANQQAAAQGRKSNLTFVDWGKVIHPRSFQHRIIGDVPAHYGLEARMAFIQMLTGHLYDKKKLVKSIENQKND